MNIDLYKKELQKAGFFSLLKTWLIVQLSANDGIQSQRALEKGMTLNKHSFFAANGNDVIWLNPNDIECFWTEGMSSIYNGHSVKHFVRTKTGKEFELSENSWLKVMYGVSYEPKVDNSKS